MRAKVKTARRKASKLHGASATFVSLVDRGANETPFKMIKSAEGTGAMGIKRKQTVGKSHKKVATGKKSAPAPKTKAIMAKMVFDQDIFEDEAAVRDWIKKAEWDADKIEVVNDADNGVFVARPDGLGDGDFTRLMKVDTSDEDNDMEGVEAYIGELIVKSEDDEDDSDEDEDDADEGDDESDDDDDDDSDDDDAEDEQKGYGGKKKPMKAEEDEDEDEAAKSKDTAKKSDAPKSPRAQFIAKAKEKVVKFNSWDAYYSKKNTLVEALKAGMSWDSTPPGFYDVQAAFNGAVVTILGDEEMDNAARQEALSKAASDYADLLGGMDGFFDAYISAGEETVKKSFADDAARDKLAKWAEGFAAFVAGADEEPATEKKVSVKKSGGDTLDMDQLGTTIADLVKKAVEPVASGLEEVSKTVTQLADRRQQKKGADLTDSPKGKDDLKKSDPADFVMQKQRKGLWG